MSTTKVSAAMQDAGAIVQVVNVQDGAVSNRDYGNGRR
jgi:hypothetical protein